jgi:hypothetical protein
MQACNTNQVKNENISHFELLSLSLNVGEVEEDLQNMRHGLNEAESILDVDGGHVSLLRGAQPNDLLLPKVLRSTLYSRVTSSQSGQNRFRISVHGVKGTVSRDFLLLVFFMNQFTPSPRVFH